MCTNDWRDTLLPVFTRTRTSRREYCCNCSVVLKKNKTNRIRNISGPILIYSCAEIRARVSHNCFNLFSIWYRARSAATEKVCSCDNFKFYIVFVWYFTFVIFLFRFQCSRLNCFRHKRSGNSSISVANWRLGTRRQRYLLHRRVRQNER